MGKKLSTADHLIRAIDKQFAAESKQVRAEAQAAIAEPRKAFEAARRAIDRAEREKLKDIERRRQLAVAALSPRKPISLSDFASVRRETADGSFVSVAGIAAIDGSATARSQKP